MTDQQRSPAVAYGRFLRSWLNDPLAVGAVAPSGRSLARRLVREVAPGHRVVELGPGTGIVTREILARGVLPRDLVLVERCTGFADHLEREHPGVTVVRGDATEPQHGLASMRGKIDFVVSGLPLVLFSREQKARLLEECFGLLQEQGALLQFTYAWRCPVARRDLERQGLVAKCVGIIALNMPPAFIYRIAREAVAA